MQHANVAQETLPDANASQRIFQTAGVRLAYRYYPAARPGARTLFCVHGFDRTSRDFIPMAEALSEFYNVVCPDLPGRGGSDWLRAKTDYHPETYATFMSKLIEHLGCGRVDYFGSSVGGIVGMLVASQTSLVERLIVNDIGPFTHKAVSRALGKAVRARKREFQSLPDAEAYVRRLHGTFGPLTDEQWRFCTTCCTRPTKSGGFVSDYDPDICVPWELEDVQDRDLWLNWERLSCPILIIRGALSTVLRIDDAQRMLKCHSQAKLVEIPEIGHAPTFYSRDQIALVREWLSASVV